MDKQKTLQQFWSSFGVPAFDENSVPDNKDIIELYGSAFPRITYDVVIGDSLDEAGMSASVWDRSSAWNGALDVYRLINDSLSNGGVILPYDGGAMWVKKASPFAQRMGDDSDDSIRRIFINISVEYISNK